jgi:hypothetical protein
MLTASFSLISTKPLRISADTFSLRRSKADGMVVARSVESVTKKWLQQNTTDPGPTIDLA